MCHARCCGCWTAARLLAATCKGAGCYTSMLSSLVQVLKVHMFAGNGAVWSLSEICNSASGCSCFEMCRARCCGCWTVARSLEAIRKGAQFHYSELHCFKTRTVAGEPHVPFDIDGVIQGQRSLTYLLFGQWVKLLRDVPRVVLWLLDGGKATRGNL